MEPWIQRLRTLVTHYRVSGCSLQMIGMAGDKPKQRTWYECHVIVDRARLPAENVAQVDRTKMIAGISTREMKHFCNYFFASISIDGSERLSSPGDFDRDLDFALAIISGNIFKLKLQMPLLKPESKSWPIFRLLFYVIYMFSGYDSVTLCLNIIPHGMLSMIPWPNSVTNVDRPSTLNSAFTAKQLGIVTHKRPFSPITYFTSI